MIVIKPVDRKVFQPAWKSVRFVEHECRVFTIEF